MPRFDRDPAAAGPLVQGFAGGGFSVDGTYYTGVLLTPAAAFEWAPPLLAELGPDDLAPALALDPPPEFLLLGTGGVFAFAPPALRRALEQRGIGIEAMDSRAAARTWGVLRAEQRWIAAALMPLNPPHSSPRFRGEGDRTKCGGGGLGEGEQP